MDEDSKVKDIMEITSPGVVNWGDVDYLIMDTPPTTERFVHAALGIKDLHGVVLVAQPATNAIADLLRTTSMLRDLHVPVLGLVGNQVYVECPHGDRVNLYDLTEQDIQKFAESQGITYLGSLPHVIPSRGFPDLDGVADKILSQSPSYLKGSPTSSLAYRVLLTLARRRKNAKN